MSVTNYLKKYPYLFVRESDQTDYLCTLCDTFVKESDLQLHLLEKHRAKDFKGNFVKVTIDPTNQTLPDHKNFIFVCIVCWSKLSSTAEMSLHTIICKLQDTVSGTRKSTTNGQDFENNQIVEKMELTNVVSTPDLYISESDDENNVQENMNGPSKMQSSTKGDENQTNMNNSNAENSKRGRKKQLHPQQVLPLPPFRVEDQPSGCSNKGEDEQSLIHCSLCNEAQPSTNYMKHIKDFHNVDCSKDNNLCPLCLKSGKDVPLVQLSGHFEKSHGVIPQTTLNALLLWGLICNTNSPSQSKVKSQEVSKPKPVTNQLKEPKKISTDHSTKMQPNIVPTLFPLTMNDFIKEPLIGLKSLNTSSGQQFLREDHRSGIPSFLQTILNSETSNSLSSEPKNLIKQDKSAIPSKESLEAVVFKLTRKFSDASTEKDSFQCLLCKKWFAIPPVKHMRGHLLNFRETEKQTAPVEGVPGECHVCLTCFQFFDNQTQAELHVVNSHTTNSFPKQDQSNDFSHMITNLKMTSPMREKANHNQDVVSSPNKLVNGLTFHETSFADPKGVELDNAGRVKSGKVRKQCELCGQWSNIKWFFKHMSEVHKALFCRCCREYLPIQEQEEHRKWHSEPPYMGQKIRLENGHPIIIDRKERASLTPIGSLAAWGGSSGGMVVKAVDDSVISMPRKRKSANIHTIYSGDLDGPPLKMNSVTSLESNGGGKTGKDTLMPKEICPVCGISITYKNLARHIKLRHKIKYKFCHKCRKLVPNDTYDDHKVVCVSLDSSPNHPRHEVLESSYSDSLNGDISDGTKEVADDETNVPDCINLSGDLSSSYLGTTPPSSMNGDSGIDASLFDGRKSDSFRANTSKTKLESLLGKEFKHPRRKCSICGYNVSYSNFKRHLRNAHPQEYIQCEKDNPDFGKAIASLCHIVDEESLAENSANDMVTQGHFLEIDSINNFVKCPLCNDHVLQTFLVRHIAMNHSEGDQEEKKTLNMKQLQEGTNVGNDMHSSNNNDEKQVVDKSSPLVVEEDQMRSCPECKIEMQSSLIVGHCRTVHKIGYKQCPSCEKFINKKAFGAHLLKHNLGERIMTRSSEVEPKHSVQDEGSIKGENFRALSVSEVDDDDDDEKQLTIDMKAASDEISS